MNIHFQHLRTRTIAQQLRQSALLLFLLVTASSVSAQRFFERSYNGETYAYLLRAPESPTLTATSTAGLWVVLAPPELRPIDVVQHERLQQAADSMGAYLVVPLPQARGAAQPSWDNNPDLGPYLLHLLETLWKELPIDQNRIGIAGPQSSETTLMQIACINSDSVSVKPSAVVIRGGKASLTGCTIPVIQLPDSVADLPTASRVAYIKPRVLSVKKRQVAQVAARPAVELSRTKEDAQFDALFEEYVRRRKGAITLSIGLGVFYNANAIKVEDPEALVSFRRPKSQVIFRVGYFATDWLELYGRFRLTSAARRQNQNIDFVGSNIQVDGRGSGGAIATAAFGAHVPVYRGRVTSGLTAEVFTGAIRAVGGLVSGTIDSLEIVSDDRRATTTGVRFGVLTDVRIGVQTSLGLDLGYSLSQPFDRDVGLLTGIQGFDFSFRFSYLFGHDKEYRQFMRQRKFR